MLVTTISRVLRCLVQLQGLLCLLLLRRHLSAVITQWHLTPPWPSRAVAAKAAVQGLGNDLARAMESVEAFRLLAFEAGFARDWLMVRGCWRCSTSGLTFRDLWVGPIFFPLLSCSGDVIML